MGTFLWNIWHGATQELLLLVPRVWLRHVPKTKGIRILVSFQNARSIIKGSSSHLEVWESSNNKSIFRWIHAKSDIIICRKWYHKSFLPYKLSNKTILDLHVQHHIAFLVQLDLGGWISSNLPLISSLQIPFFCGL